MAGYLLSSVTIREAAVLVRELGGDPVAIAAPLGIWREALERPDIPLPARAVGGFFERAAHRCSCRSFGLQLAQRSSLAVLGPLWAMLRNAGTVRQMLEDLAANYALFTSAASMSVQDSEQGLILSWETTVSQLGPTVQSVEFVMALLCKELRLRCGAAWFPRAVVFRHAPPDDAQLHRRHFGPNLQFNGDRNALYLDGETLARPVNREGAPLRSMMQLWMRRDGGLLDRGLAARVEEVVRALLPFAPCTLEEVARVLGIAPRTLQTHLNQQGRSFKAIKDAVRADLAMKYLRESSLPLAEIAEILGYAELSTFSRSFRRWFGTPASRVREQALQALCKAQGVGA